MSALRESERSIETKEGFKKLEGRDDVKFHKNVKCHTQTKMRTIEASLHLGGLEPGSSSLLYISLLPQKSESEDSDAPSPTFLPPHSQPGFQSPGAQPPITTACHSHATGTLAGDCRPLRQ